MKRSIFLYILGVVCAALFSLPASAVNSLRLEPLEIPSEGVTTVNAVFTADQNIIGFQTEVIIPEGLTLVMTDDSYCYYPDNTNPFQIISSNLVDNTLKVLGVTTDNSAFPSSGVLFSFKVQAESGFTGESMKLENNIFTASDFTDINIYNVASIKLSETSWSGVEGSSVKLTATVSPEDATNPAIIWSSSDESVATVAEDGTVTAVKPGTAVITATAADGSGVKATCDVTVTAKVIPVTAITLSMSEWSGVEGSSVKLNATVSPDDATNPNVIWSSSDESVATVAEDGTVTAVKPGTAVITATAADGSGVKATCDVTVTAKVIPVAAITLSMTEWSGVEGSSVKLTATVSPEDATNPNVIWSSSDESVATVAEDGMVTAVKPGTAVITATATDGSGVKATCDVTVTAKVIPVAAITLSMTEWSAVEGSSVKLTATVSPDDATNPNVVWSSSDESVATVAEDGTVTAVKPGTAVITATAADGSGVKATCDVTVTAKIILAEALTIDPSSWSGEVGESFRITAVINPENTTDKTLKWSSSDNSVASVDDTGLVTVLKQGYCIITVSTVDGSDLSAKCTITGVSGVNGIFTEENNTVDVYSTQGILLRRNCDREELKQLGNGIYILRSGNKANTVIIR